MPCAAREVRALRDYEMELRLLPPSHSQQQDTVTGVLRGYQIRALIAHPGEGHAMRQPQMHDMSPTACDGDLYRGTRSRYPSANAIHP